MDFKVDTTYEYYLKNWYLEMPDMKCMSPHIIGIMVTLYFLGYALNGVFSILPDQIGRKKTTLYVMILSNFA